MTKLDNEAEFGCRQQPCGCEQSRAPLTLCREKVRTQKVASSMVSSRVTWVMPYVSVPRLGQYWSHLIWKVGQRASVSVVMSQQE